MRRFTMALVCVGPVLLLAANLGLADEPGSDQPPRLGNSNAKQTHCFAKSRTWQGQPHDGSGGPWTLANGGLRQADWRCTRRKRLRWDGATT